MAGRTPIIEQGAPANYWDDPQGIDGLIKALYSVYNRGKRAMPYYRGRALLPGAPMGMEPLDALTLAQMYEQQRNAGPDAARGAGSGAGGAGGVGAGGGALAAVQHQPAYTGGGAYFPGGAVENRVAGLSERDDEWLGLDTLTPDERLATGRSPNAVNWDDIRRIGSRCVRSGTAKLDDDRDTVTISSSSISADYRGLSLAAMPGSGDNQNKLLICFADNSIGSTRTAHVTTMHLCATSLRWGKPLNLTGWPGPKLALSDQTGNVLRVTYDYTNVFSAANDGLRKASVKGIIIRYSLLGYPLDRDGLDNRNDYPTPLRDRTAWGGESATVDTTATAAFSGQRVYVSAWAFGVEGFSEPSHASLTMA